MRVKTFILATSAAGALALSAGTASAEPNGWYGAVDAGYNTSDNLEVVGGPRLDLETDGSWAGFARLGYRFTPNWRVELEGGYRSAGDLQGVTNPAGTPTLTGICNVTPATGACNAPDGDIRVSTLMTNVIYDFGNEDWGFRPFIGLGAGVAEVATKFNGTVGGNRTVGISTDDSSTELAAQALAGVAVRLGDRANIDLTYRYLMSDFGFDTATTVASPARASYEGEFENHSLTLGLRYSFGAMEPAYVPPPAPQPLPPAPQPPAPRPTPPAPVIPADREFVVYFDWDRSDLTAEAQSVVTQAANYAKSGRPTRILIVGHADTSGSAAYNVGLSNRRARTVGDALVAQGINGGVISLDGKGETALARATADGVREPLNRRATVGINFR